MSLKTYHLLTVWHFDTTVERIWNVVNDIEKIPSWWPGVSQVRLLGGDKKLSEGALVQTEVRGLFWTLRFKLRVKCIEPPYRLSAESTGDLAGEGYWILYPEAGGTRAECHWWVSTTGRWMNLLGTLIRPLLKYSHNRVMAEGGRALARQVGSVY